MFTSGGGPGPSGKSNSISSFSVSSTLRFFFIGSDLSFSDFSFSGFSSVPVALGVWFSITKEMFIIMKNQYYALRKGGQMPDNKRNSQNIHAEWEYKGGQWHWQRWYHLSHANYIIFMT